MEQLLMQMDSSLQLVEEMYELSQRKREVIVGGDAAAMEAVLREETGLLARMRLAEEERQRSAMLAAIALGIRPAGVTVSQLLEKAPPEQAERLRVLRERTREQLERLSRLNDTNRMLLQTQVDIMRYYIESSTRPTQLGVQYSGTGADVNTQDPVNLFDTQV